MNTPYTDHDTERVRQHERASLTPAPITLPGNSVRQRNNTAALLLIGLGALFMVGRIIPGWGELTAGLILLTIASGFLFFAFARRIFGLLIPGSILAGLALGIPLAGFTNGISVVWGLALGFMAIAVLGRSMFGVNSTWAVIPAIPLFLVGVIIMLASLPSIFGLGAIGLPLLLIGAGLYLGWGRRLAH